MNQILAMLFAAAVFVTAVVAEAASLRTEAIIEGDRVTLGDLFDGLAPDRAQVAIAQAPAPGRRVVLEARWLVRVARAYGVDYRPASASETIAVTRASNTVNFDGVEALLMAELRPRLGPGEIELEVGGIDREVHLPAGVDPTVALADFSYSRQTNQFTAVLVAPAEAEAAEQVRIAVRGSARVVVEVPVLARRLRDGDVIGAGDITWIAIDGNRVPTEVARTEDDLIGLAVRRSLPSGDMVQLSDLRPPVMIARGTTVLIRYTAGPLAITARGRSLQDGADGELIRVVNIDSSRTVEALITGPDTVSVVAAAALPLN